MWSALLDAITIASEWPWLAPLTSVTRAVGAVLGLIASTLHLITWQRDHHRTAAGTCYRNDHNA